jgi:hypothetical protein
MRYVSNPSNGGALVTCTIIFICCSLPASTVKEERNLFGRVGSFNKEGKIEIQIQLPFGAARTPNGNYITNRTITITK